MDLAYQDVFLFCFSCFSSVMQVALTPESAALCGKYENGVRASLDGASIQGWLLTSNNGVYCFALNMSGFATHYYCQLRTNCWRVNLWDFSSYFCTNCTWGNERAAWDAR